MANRSTNLLRKAAEVYILGHHKLGVATANRAVIISAHTGCWRLRKKAISLLISMEIAERTRKAAEGAAHRLWSAWAALPKTFCGWAWLAVRRAWSMLRLKG